MWLLVFLWIKKNTFHFSILFSEICPTYDGLVSKALPLRNFFRGGFFVYNKRLSENPKAFCSVCNEAELIFEKSEYVHAIGINHQCQEQH